MGVWNEPDGSLHTYRTAYLRRHLLDRFLVTADERAWDRASTHFATTAPPGSHCLRLLRPNPKPYAAAALTQLPAGDGKGADEGELV